MEVFVCLDSLFQLIFWEFIYVWSFFCMFDTYLMVYWSLRNSRTYQILNYLQDNVYGFDQSIISTISLVFDRPISNIVGKRLPDFVFSWYWLSCIVLLSWIDERNSVRHDCNHRRRFTDSFTSVFSEIIGSFSRYRILFYS